MKQNYALQKVTNDASFKELNEPIRFVLNRGVQ